MKESIQEISERFSKIQEKIHKILEDIAKERLKNMDKSKLVSHKDMFK